MRTHLKPLAALLPLAFVSDLHAQQALDPLACPGADVTQARATLADDDRLLTPAD